MTPNVSSNSKILQLSATDLKISKSLPRTKKLKVVFSKDWQPRIALISEGISVSSG